LRFGYAYLDLPSSRGQRPPLAEVTETLGKSLHRMLSPRGNPSMDNLSAIFGAVRHWLKVAFEVHTIKAA